MSNIINNRKYHVINNMFFPWQKLYDTCYYVAGYHQIW